MSANTDPAAAEAVIRHMAKRVHDVELALGVAVWNLALKDSEIAARDELIAELKEAADTAEETPDGR